MVSKGKQGCVLFLSSVLQVCVPGWGFLGFAEKINEGINHILPLVKFPLDNVKHFELTSAWHLISLSCFIIWNLIGSLCFACVITKIEINCKRQGRSMILPFYETLMKMKLVCSFHRKIGGSFPNINAERHFFLNNDSHSCV